MPQRVLRGRWTAQVAAEMLEMAHAWQQRASAMGRRWSCDGRPHRAVQNQAICCTGRPRRTVRCRKWPCGVREARLSVGAARDGGSNGLQQWARGGPMAAAPIAPYRIRPSVVRDGLAGQCGAENGPVVYARLVLASGAARDGGSKSRTRQYREGEAARSLVIPGG